MRAKDFINKEPVKEQVVVEIVPAIGMALGRVGSAIGGAVAKVGAKAGAAVAKGVGKVAASTAKSANKFAANVGKSAMKQIGQAQDDVVNNVLKKGNKLSLPKQGGAGEEDFDIDDVKGDQVILKNPKPAPGEPNAFVYKKSDLDGIVKQKAQQATQGGGGKVV